MVFLQRRAPAGVVDDDVDEDARIEGVGDVGEFAKLINARGAFIKLNERGIHSGQIQRGIRAAETAEARVGCGRRMHGQQMNDAAAELVDDERQLFFKITESSRRRQGGVALRFERFQLRFQFFIGGAGEIFGRAKKPCEGAVNGVGGAREVWVNGNPHVGAVGPMLPVFIVEQIGLGFEVADFSEGQLDLPAVGGGLHRHIAPGGIGDDRLTGVGGNDFLTAGGGAAEVGAKTGRPFF